MVLNKFNCFKLLIAFSSNRFSGTSYPFSERNGLEWARTSLH